MNFAMNQISFQFSCQNVRGLGHSQKGADILSELISINPHACMLQETKLSALHPQKMRSFLPGHLDAFHHKDATGSTGGSAFASSQFTLMIKSATHNPPQFSASPPIKPYDHKSLRTYGSCSKRCFLRWTGCNRPPASQPWIVLGDFNMMREPTNKNNSSFRQSEADLFNATLNSLALIELPLMDRQFTWSSKCDLPTLEKNWPSFYQHFLGLTVPKLHCVIFDTLYL